MRTLLLLCLFLSACTPGLQGDPDIGPTDGDDDSLLIDSSEFESGSALHTAYSGGGGSTGEDGREVRRGFCCCCCCDL